MMKATYCFTISIILLFFLACKSDNRFRVDVNNDRIDVRINRMDLDLLQADSFNPTSIVDSLLTKYPVFFPVYVEELMDMTVEEKDSVGQALSNFISSSIVYDVNNSVIDRLSDVCKLEKELSDGYTILHHFFPSVRLPELYFFLSGLNQRQILSLDHTFIGIGSDFYLGSDYPLYKSIVYDYMLPQMDAERIVPDILSTILFNTFLFDSENHNRLMDQMLYMGKVYFLLSVLMPDRQAEEVIGYTSAQWDWAVSHEKDSWNAIVGHKDLFTSDYQQIRRYLYDAPFTAPVSQDSPGRLGVFIGYQIVKSYMNNNKSVLLQELMRQNNYQLLLEQSKYNP